MRRRSHSLSSFGPSLPGTLTGIAAVVTAVATLAGVLIARDGSDSPGSAVPAAQAQPAETDYAPAEGVVGEAYIAGWRDGPPTRTLNGPVVQLWAVFPFTTPPERGRRLSVRWRRPDGELQPPIEKGSARRIVAVVRDDEPLATGVWHALLYVDDVVVKDVKVEVAGERTSDPPGEPPIYGAD